MIAYENQIKPFEKLASDKKNGMYFTLLVLITRRMTVKGDVYMIMLNMMHNIPMSIDLSLWPWRNVKVMKTTINKNRSSTIKATVIFFRMAQLEKRKKMMI